MVFSIFNLCEQIGGGGGCFNKKLYMYMLYMYVHIITQY